MRSINPSGESKGLGQAGSAIWLWGDKQHPADSEREEAKEWEPSHSDFPLGTTNGELWICSVTKCAKGESRSSLTSKGAGCGEAHL